MDHRSVQTPANDLPPLIMSRSLRILGSGRLHFLRFLYLIKGEGRGWSKTGRDLDGRNPARIKPGLEGLREELPPKSLTEDRAV